MSRYETITGLDRPIESRLFFKEEGLHVEVGHIRFDHQDVRIGALDDVQVRLRAGNFLDLLIDELLKEILRGIIFHRN